MIRTVLAGLCLLVLVACTERVKSDSAARILVMGDSLMAVNRAGGGSVADALEASLGEDVIDRAVIGAGMLGSAEDAGIPGQFVAHDWDWVVLNGYGNDLLFGCSCSRCDSQMDRLISRDGRAGAIPDLVAQLREDGARVIYSGYLRTPGFLSPVEACVPLGEEMDRRIAAMAARDAGTFFLDLSTLVPDGDMSFHGADRIHPSAKGSRAIAARAAGLIRSAEAR